VSEKPTVTELEEILNKGNNDLEIQILPNGQVSTRKKRPTIDELEEILTKKKPLGGGY